MTGMTMMVFRGKKALLCKVRHSGYDVLEWIKEATVKKILKMKCVDDVWGSYYNWRYKDSTDISRESEIESCYQKTGFIFTLPKKNMTEEEMFERAYMLLKAGQTQDERDNFSEGLLCSYGDYTVIVNLDKEILTVNGLEYKVYLKEENKREVEYERENIMDGLYGRNLLMPHSEARKVIYGCLKAGGNQNLLKKKTVDQILDQLGFPPELKKKAKPSKKNRSHIRGHKRAKHALKSL